MVPACSLKVRAIFFAGALALMFCIVLFSPDISSIISPCIPPVVPSCGKKDLDIFIAIPSGAHPESAVRRKKFRETCVPNLHKHGLPYLFYVGHPAHDSRSMDAHIWGQKPTETEKDWALALEKEQQEYGDLHFVPMQDHYLALTDKTLHILRDGYESGASFIVKMDDDMCLDPSRLFEFSRSKAYAEIMLYAGENHHIHKDISYMGGPLYVLSRNLVARIMSPELNAFVHLYALYGSSDEDKNLGFWVERIRKAHPGAVDKRELNLALSGEHKRR